MNDRLTDCVCDVIHNIEHGLGYKAAISSLMSLAGIDLGDVPESKCNQLLQKICAAMNEDNGPLLILSLPQNVQAEIALFAEKKIPGIDRTAYLKATPTQVVRKLTSDSTSDRIADLLRANYDFSRFRAENWEEYFSRCSALFPAAQSFLARDEASGGFSEAKITGVLLRNPSLVPSVPSKRISPDTAVALLISGRAESLWESYDFSRLGKNHWNELFLHTNPDRLPEASRPFIENKDGKGFTDDELLTMAQKCHALINFLNPNKVPFNVVYELSLTGRVGLLWKNYPFASLDKSEWRMVLANPHMKIPDYFLNVVGSGRFTVEELCDLSVRNDRLFPILLKLNIPPDKVVKILLACKADYIWENYHFSRFAAADFAKLILGLKDDAILKPRAMMELKTCRDLTEAQVRKILSKNPAYAPNVPISAITPDVAVDLLIRGKSYFLWDAYDFRRLNDEQWLRLLVNTTNEVPPVGKDFLRYRAGAVDNNHLNAVLARRKDLIEFVDAKYIAVELAVSILMSKPRHELWDRFNFSRLDSKQLMRVIMATEHTQDAFPKSLHACFRECGRPFQFDDLLEVAAINPCVVIDNIATEWIESIADDSFEKLVRVVASSNRGVESLRKRLSAGERPWNTLPLEKLKRLLLVAPELRSNVGWSGWSFRDIAELARTNHEFEQGLQRPFLYFLWKHFKSLAAMATLTAAAIIAILIQNQKLQEIEAQRQHWNAIVQRVRDLDRKMEYKELQACLNSIPYEDMDAIRGDLFVKNARKAVAEWKSRCDAIEEGMSRLRTLARAGWNEKVGGETDGIIRVLEKNQADRSGVAKEYEDLKASHDAYKKEKVARERIKELKGEIESIKDGIPYCEYIPTAKEWLALLEKMAEESELRDAATNVAEVVAKKINELETGRTEKLAREVAAVSNAVFAVSAELMKLSAVELFAEISSNFNGIVLMPGFEEYSKSLQVVDYELLKCDIGQFEGLKLGCEKQNADAKRLDAKFANEFMTVDGGAECSDVLARCETTVKCAMGKRWVSIVEECSKIKSIIDNVNARDLRCWSLVDKINSAHSYTEYLAARRALIKDFGHISQLRHLRDLHVVEPEDLQTESGHGGKTARYRFVGVVKLMPDEPSKTLISVGNGGIRRGAEIYTLKKSRNVGETNVFRELLVLVGENGKYYKADGADFYNRQGTPLFVRSEDCIYIGKGGYDGP